MAGYIRTDTTNNIATGNVINASDLDNEFDAIVAAFNASTGHTHDGSSAEGAPITVIGPAQDFIATGSLLRPKTDAAYDLGSSSFKFNDAYFAGNVTADSFTGDIIGDIVGTITGNADTATALETARTIAISGQITGTATSFDGTANISIPVSVLNASNLNSGTVPNARVSGSYTGITGTGALNAGSISSGFGNINIGASVFTGNGSGITNINASNIATGTVANARISGSYTNFTSISGSGNATFDQFEAISAGSSTNPSYSWDEDVTTGMHYISTPGIRFTVDGSNKLQIDGSQILAMGGATFTGDASGLSDINADNISAGTVGNARISGAYSNFSSISGSGNSTFNRMIGGVGSAAAPAFTFSGAGDTGILLNSTTNRDIRFSIRGVNKFEINESDEVKVLGGAVFSGDGSDLTTLNASELDSGTVPVDRFGTSSGYRDWVLERISGATHGSVGTYAWLNRTSGTGIIGAGDNISGSNLAYSGVYHSGTQDASVSTGGSSPSGTWKAMGRVLDDTAESTLFLRVS